MYQQSLVSTTFSHVYLRYMGLLSVFSFVTYQVVFQLWIFYKSLVPPSQLSLDPFFMLGDNKIQLEAQTPQMVEKGIG